MLLELKDIVRRNALRQERTKLTAPSPSSFTLQSRLTNVVLLAVVPILTKTVHPAHGTVYRDNISEYVSQAAAKLIQQPSQNQLQDPRTRRPPANNYESTEDVQPPVVQNSASLIPVL
ncbi:hypothetical protein Tco_0748588 [Tanacetum coccineum]|uniref:Uncharacterized protein n=1 Tax=Tanacetum coccineum TaxID=301880 RepID=A0ABQ4YZ08_9ASTR